MKKRNQTQVFVDGREVFGGQTVFVTAEAGDTNTGERLVIEGYDHEARKPIVRWL